MTDLHWLEAHEAAELIATKQITSLELTRALLDRIEKYDNGPVSYTHLTLPTKA